MDIERNSKGSRFSNQQNQDRSSYRSSVMSLERFSDRRHSSLSNHVSLVNAMDIQVSNRSQHDDLLDPDGNRFSDLRRASHKSKQQVYSFAAEMQEKDLNRKSQYKIQHECKCVEEQCMGVHCICFLTPRQICVIGQCCPQCIAIKNEYLQVTRGFQVRRRGEERTKEEESEALKQIRQRKCNNMHYMKQVYANDPTIRDLIFCTCKKSHCQKKYCLCFEKGQKCGEFCACIECQNRIPEEDEDYFREEEQRRWQRYATYKPYEQQENDKQNQIDQDIEQFIEEEAPQQGCFNETMEFEPVNFDHLGS